LLGAPREIATLATLATAVAVGLFYLSTIRPGQSWGDDFAMYVRHARNLAQGTSYSETGYIFNPNFSGFAPRTYPPVFPVLIAPVYRLFGLDLEAMKVVSILFFVAALLTLAALLHDAHSPWRAPLVIGLVGFHPYFWQFKDHVLSDLPFLFFILLALLASMRAHQAHRSPSSRWGLAILAGIAIYLASGTRTLGVLLVPALIGWDILRRRRVSAVTAVATAVFLVGTGVQRLLLVSDTNYLDEVILSTDIVARNTIAYLRDLSEFWDDGRTDILRKILFLVSAPLVVVGYLIRLAERRTPAEVFVPLYVLVVLVWPFHQGPRFLIPIVPFYMLYLVVGLDWVGRRGPRRWRPSLPSALLVLLLVAAGAAYALKYSSLGGTLKEGVHKKESQELFTYVSRNTDPRDVFVFAKPRALSLFTERRASVYHRPADSSDLWRYMRAIGATYVVEGPEAAGGQEYLHGLVTRYRHCLEPTFHNLDFAVYRVRPACS
jgi:4-amino-4-deoxy-L-arabinose transferase-like glycosyltransferase